MTMARTDLERWIVDIWQGATWYSLAGRMPVGTFDAAVKVKVGPLIVSSGVIWYQHVNNEFRVVGQRL